MTPGRELRLAVGLCLLGSVVALVALQQSWFDAATGDRLTIDAVRTSVRGTEVATGASALGYVGLAGVVALAATRRWGRVLVGVLVLAAGSGIVLDVAAALRAGIEDRALPHAGLSSCSGADGGRAPGCGTFLTDASTTPGWAWLAILGGALVLLSGLLVALRGRGWAALSSSYEVPAARAEVAPATDKEVWDALDRGEDPTRPATG